MISNLEKFVFTVVTSLLMLATSNLGNSNNHKPSETSAIATFSTLTGQMAETQGELPIKANEKCENGKTVP
ncbi:hypothetical protein H6F77_08485 [Microcoleus sp. FACHB-831]|uniref:hypothetical protein n=1 Tax=Microcoleus sp. FACHB-831 TaxID=2692827 RepID=UPI0016826626|nr:hypothetical protein [Microcoleus sp. FACHB-831]MBD1921127.1 hypothetical protein [Microcoleus sp. FACHB-831]